MFVPLSCAKIVVNTTFRYAHAHNNDVLEHFVKNWMSNKFLDYHDCSLPYKGQT
jgi:hypothetical protein